ncbi:MAG: N-6 DNA methylase, partial [Desulfovibrio sp.]|nr:N-6 DNA methylase [Desulfovibrio sp.]
GRIMRNFRRGKDGGKKFGYILLPVVVPAGVSPEEALNDNERFQVVWKLLNALRAHDDHFNALVNQIALNEKRPDKIVVSEWPGDGEWWWDGKEAEDEEGRRRRLVDVLLAESSVRDLLYGKIVEKVGERTYWDKWARSVGDVAQKLIGRIGDILKEEGEHRQVFDAFLAALRENLNPSVTEAAAVEMLAQYLVTGPVFDALFQDYDFGENNPVSRSMHAVVLKLEEKGLLKDTEILHRFYESVRANVGQIDNAASRQDIIRTLYERFFKGAFEETVKKLGIVYTPVEVVDFILRSAEAVMQKEFGRSISDEDVHVLDPFVGTGTFIARLLQSGIVKDGDLLRKYRSEIHANEIVLLAYYVADVNIENAFNGVWRAKHPDAPYERYDGIVLTDTFDQYEKDVHAGEAGILPGMEAVILGENTKAIERQKQAPIRVIIGNPPYSKGQKAANDNAQNESYPKLEDRIAKTYVAAGSATRQAGVYDSYIKAFRWASDRIQEKDGGGVVAFVSNAGWLDGSAMDGMRKCLEEEFSAVYVVNLRGDQRTSGELSRKEGGKIFGSGSRTPVAITILVKKPGHTGKGAVHYYAVDDYLKREEKLKLLKETPDVFSLPLETLQTDGKGGWLYQRNAVFDSFIPLGDKKAGAGAPVLFGTYSLGIATNRDAWCYGCSAAVLEANMKKSITFYNEEVERISELRREHPDYDAGTLVSFLTFDSTRFSWDRQQKSDVVRGKKYAFSKKNMFTCMYRPFFRENGYVAREMNNCVYQMPKIFPTPSHANRVICVSGARLPLMVDHVPDLHFNGDTQCFPLNWFEEETIGTGKKAGRLPGMEQAPKFTRRDGITNWALERCRSLYPGQSMTKENIFYFVYGVLHSQEYRAAFGEDLKKSLPHVPFPNAFSAFDAFSRAGRELAELHLHYEEQPSWPGVEVEGDSGGPVEVEQMHWRRLGGRQLDKTVLHVNGAVTVKAIPARAHEYVVNGKSALDWLVERYAVTVDKASGIRNDPNAWGREHGNPRYILELVLSVITVSMRTLEIVDGLPKLRFGEDGAGTPQE